MIDLAQNISWIMGVVNGVGALIILIYERRNPRAAVLWLLFLFIIPAFGLIIYLLFGRAMHRTRRKYRAKEAADRKGLEDLAMISVAGSLTVMEEGMASYLSLVHMLEANLSRLTVGNGVTLINTGEEKFGRLFEDLEGSRDHIHAEYYIVRDDDLGKQFLELLAKKAGEGLKVKLLVDGVGTRLPLEKVQELQAKGVEVLQFFPPVVRSVPALNLRLNHRNHRKIVVVDGTIGYLGGYNVGDEYLGKQKLGRWRDTHLRIEGPAVLDLQARFLLDWDFSSSRSLELSPRLFPSPPMPGTGAVQIVSSGPDKREDLVKEAYLKMISLARNSVHIQSPYFVPDESILDALRVAALSGVEVKVMVPRLRDHPLVHWANIAYLGELVEAGVRAYLFEPGFLHSKTIVVDGAVVSVGSANWDIRSFELNFETNAVIYCRKVATAQEQAFLRDLQESREWTLSDHLSRSPSVRLRCALARVFTPLL